MADFRFDEQFPDKDRREFAESISKELLSDVFESESNEVRRIELDGLYFDDILENLNTLKSQLRLARTFNFEDFPCTLIDDQKIPIDLSQVHRYWRI